MDRSLLAMEIAVVHDTQGHLTQRMCPKCNVSGETFGRNSIGSPSDDVHWYCGACHFYARITSSNGKTRVRFGGLGMTEREPIVKFYKDRSKGGNGAFATVTTATTPEEFLQNAANSMALAALQFDGDMDFTFAALLPQICEIWAKLRGYKSDIVTERRMLMVGDPNPDAHMDLVTGEPVESVSR